MPFAEWSDPADYPLAEELLGSRANWDTTKWYRMFVHLGHSMKKNNLELPSNISAVPDKTAITIDS